MRFRAHALLVAAVTVFVGATIAAARQPQNAPGNYVGPGSCSAVACHGSLRPVAGARILQTEYTTWVAQDRHARATEVLSNAVSTRMGRILGVERPQQAKRCLACHSLDAPASERARNFTDEGVSCEACHGPATGWLGYHVTRDARHDESVRRGMYDTKDVVKRTEKCLTCHLGTAEKFVDHEMIAAGHPDLVFELDAFTAAMPRHWRDPATTEPATGVRTFAVGQLVHLRSALDRLARRAKGPIWPEYAELECFSCHHSLTRPEDSWRQAGGYADRARPGLPPLNVARYVTARRVLQAYDAPAGSELDSVMTKLQMTATRLRGNENETASLAEQARTIVDRGVARALSAPASPEIAATIMRGIFADTPELAARGERAAEQAAMAVEGLAALAARDRATGDGRSPAFAEVFQQFESPSAYDPRRFVAAMKRLEATLVR